MICHQLGKVFVGSDHQHLVETSLLGLRREGSYDIVSLVASLGNDRDIETGNDAVDVWQRRSDILRHLVAVGLILLELLMTKGRF